MTSPPPSTSPSDVSTALAGPGYAVLDATSLVRAIGIDLATFVALAPLWDDLPRMPTCATEGTTDAGVTAAS